jgi:hypothetical protein
LAISAIKKAKRRPRQECSLLGLYFTHFAKFRYFDYANSVLKELAQGVLGDASLITYFVTPKATGAEQPVEVRD